MQAAFYTCQGDAHEVFQVGALPDPIPGPGEVLVRVEASGVNPSDVKGRQLGRGPMEHPLIVPHSDGAGTVVAVGQNGPSQLIGRRIWTHNAQWNRAFGTAAELIALPSNLVAPLPDEMSFEEGACLGIPAMTAHQAIFADGPVSGRWVLVTGGAGSVGHYAIQFAKWGGARVIATVSGEAKAAHAAKAGADYVLNYRTTDIAAAVLDLTNGRGVDHLVEVEFGGNLETTKRVIAENGSIAAYASSADRYPSLPFYEFMYRNVLLRTILVYSMRDEAKAGAIRGILKAQQDGALTHAIGARFDIRDIAAAHEAVEQGSIGNVIVTLR
ncbi:NADPH:quinone reductase [Microvirga terricola]|uniref:NADPH:quinone reductase n=1 Tax=Microvirga terricola TaxID=2719797 RepID=A0ABX0V640_9HYPH|nr:NADPH:quinone reductase [Microvirga terricola]NIX75310.1 NADPH:quinone reductase [Microvirga terricola]